MSEKNTFRIMLTCAGGDLSAQLIKSIQDIDCFDYTVDVIATDAGEQKPVAFSLCEFSYKVPFGDHKDYIPTMLDIVKDKNVDLIVPRSDEEALSLSKNRKQFEDLGCQVACMDYQTLEIFSNKAKTYQKLEELGIPVAAWKEVSTTADLKNTIDQMTNDHGAVIVKPSISRGGRNIYYIARDANIDHSDYQDNPEIAFIRYNDLQSIRLEDEFGHQFPVVVMQPLYRPVYDLDMLAWEGKAISIVPRRRVQSDYPNAGHLVLDDSHLVTIGEEIIEGFNLSWIYDCDLMADKDGIPYPIEINPRMSGSIAVSLVAGSRLFELLIKILNGDAVKRQSIDHMNGKTLLPMYFLKDAKTA